MDIEKIAVTVIRTDKGKIRIQFKDGGSYLIPDTMENIPLIVAFEVEIDFARKSNQKVIEVDPMQLSFIQSACGLKDAVYPLHPASLTDERFEEDYGFKKEEMENAIKGLKHIVWT